MNTTHKLDENYQKIITQIALSDAEQIRDIISKKMTIIEPPKK